MCMNLKKSKSKAKALQNLTFPPLSKELSLKAVQPNLDNRVSFST